jgi:HlyD family secretion protein
VEAPPVLDPKPDAPKPRRKGRKKLFIFAGLALVGLAVLFYFATRKTEPEISVTTEKVARHTLTETVVANGRIYPVLQIHISAEVSGEIIELNVKEGQFVRKGDLLLKIKPDFYEAALNQSKASFESSLASRTTASANLEKAEAEFKRNKDLFEHKLVSESDYVSFKVARDVAVASVQSASNQIEVARASVASAEESLSKTTILAPIDGTVSKLNSQKGERVLGTVQNAGTDIMVISDLSAMEARVDIGEMDIVLLKPGEKATLEVDSFKDKKFAGIVTDVANSSKDMNASTSSFNSSSSSSSGQSATQFQVKIRFSETAEFRPGMSVSATIETRTRTNVLGAPIAAVTTRVVKGKGGGNSSKTNSVATNSVSGETNAVANGTNSAVKPDKKSEGGNKPVEVVFVIDGDKVKTVPVKIGISDDNFWEITDGLKEGDEIVTGGFKAISRDLDDGKKVKKNGGAAGKM